MRHWMKQVVLALDQLINALLGGWADETMSSRAWRTECSGRIGGRIMRPLIDALFFFDPNHCLRSFDAERDSRQLPPEFRTHG